MMLLINIGNLPANDNSPDSLSCYGIFKMLYYEKYSNAIFDWDTKDVHTGQRNYLYYIKFFSLEQTPVYPEKMKEELNKVVIFLNDHPKISVSIIIHNAWLEPFHSDVLNYQKKYIYDHLTESEIAENRFIIKIDRKETRIIGKDNPALSQFRCSEGVDPFFEINSWVDVVVCR